MLLSEQLCTCPSLKPSLTQTCYQLSVVVLGKGWVHTFLDTVIDSNYFTRLGVIPRITIWSVCNKYYSPCFHVRLMIRGDIQKGGMHSRVMNLEKLPLVRATSNPTKVARLLVLLCLKKIRLGFRFVYHFDFSNFSKDKSNHTLNKRLLWPSLGLCLL